MRDGFLGYDTTFMLDFVVCALVVIVPILAFSIHQVRTKRNYRLHRNLQLTLGLILFVAVSAFEVDVQFLHGGWENIVNKPDRPMRLSSDELAEVRRVLRIHLGFAVSTPVLWAVTIALALWRYPNPPLPGPHSRVHIPLAWLSTLDLVATSMTGLWFYYAAFVAPGG
jgi:hypothetical protein